MKYLVFTRNQLLLLESIKHGSHNPWATSEEAPKFSIKTICGIIVRDIELFLSDRFDSRNADLHFVEIDFLKLT